MTPKCGAQKEKRLEWCFVKERHFSREATEVANDA
jgi:hypothetical protein